MSANYTVPQKILDKSAKCMRSGKPCPGHRWRDRGTVLTLNCNASNRTVTVSLTAKDCRVDIGFSGYFVEDGQ